MWRCHLCLAISLISLLSVCHAQTKCGQFEVDKMEEWPYNPYPLDDGPDESAARRRMTSVSNKGTLQEFLKENFSSAESTPKTVKVASGMKQVIYTKDYRSIFVGYFEGKCVALKSFDLQKNVYAREDFENNIAIQAELKRKLPMEEQRAHILHTFDIGLCRERKLGLLIMELGDSSFDVRSNTHIEDEGQLIELTRQLMRPLLELHHVAMHLDIKPSNFHFFDGTLKLLDLDGAIGVPDEKAEGKNADTLVSSVNTFCTEGYVPPERKYRSEMSTKVDIWSVAVIIYDILLHQSCYKMKTESQFGKAALRNTAFRDSIFTDADTRPLTPVRMRSLLSEDADQLRFILEFRRDFPRHFVLLTNLLHYEPEERMSAKGTLDFLDGKCRPALELSRADDDEPLLFHAVTPSALRKAIVEKKKATCVLFVTKKQELQLLLDILAQGDAKQAGLAKTISHLADCDTVTNAFFSAEGTGENSLQ